MHFSTSTAAYALHAQQAQRNARDIERRRVIAARMAEAGATDGITEGPVVRRRPHGLVLFAQLVGRLA